MAASKRVMMIVAKRVTMVTPKLAKQAGVVNKASAINKNYARIYAVIKKIPKGKVATYGQIASLAGIPRGARQVGTALRNTPDNLKLPWQRVINAQGRISLRLKDWEAGGDDYQRVLLEGEGVIISAEGKIDLKRFRWLPPSLYEGK